MLQKDFNKKKNYRIRSWDDLQSEFGINKYGDVFHADMYDQFTMRMKCMCGKILSKKHLHKLQNGCLYLHGHRITFWMLEELPELKKPYMIFYNEKIVFNNICMLSEAQIKLQYLRGVWQDTELKFRLIEYKEIK
jgi:hypothetical protein